MPPANSGSDLNGNRRLDTKSRWPSDAFGQAVKEMPAQSPIGHTRTGLGLFLSPHPNTSHTLRRRHNTPSPAHPSTMPAPCWSPRAGRAISSGSTPARSCTATGAPAVCTSSGWPSSSPGRPPSSTSSPSACSWSPSHGPTPSSAAAFPTAAGSTPPLASSTPHSPSSGPHSCCAAISSPSGSPWSRRCTTSACRTGPGSSGSAPSSSG